MSIGSPPPSILVPISYAYWAYKNATYNGYEFRYPILYESRNIPSRINLREGPHTIAPFFAWPKTISYGTVEYNEAFRNLPGNLLKMTLEPFLKTKGIREDLIIAEARNPGVCAALGTNYFTKGYAVVLVAPNFERTDREACHWTVKHEIGHIHANDAFTIPLVGAICSAAAAIFTAFYAIPVITSILITVTIGIIAHAIFAQYREAKADDFSIASSSNEELLGGRRFLLSFKAANIAQRTSFSNRLLYSSDGENRVAIFHPSNARRIRKIENALAARGVTIDEPMESRKIRLLTEFLSQEIKQIEQKLKDLGFCGILKAQMES